MVRQIVQVLHIAYSLVLLIQQSELTIHAERFGHYKWHLFSVCLIFSLKGMHLGSEDLNVVLIHTTNKSHGKQKLGTPNYAISNIFS